MKLYLAGPMTGVPDFNFPAFDDAARQLRAHGYEVFNPAELDRENGFDPTGLNGYENLTDLGFSYREVLGKDLAWICAHAEGLVTLPRAMLSNGARAEIATARAIRIPVYTLEQALEMNP